MDSLVHSDSDEVNKPCELQQSEQQSEQDPHREQQRQVILQITPACAIAQIEITEKIRSEIFFKFLIIQSWMEIEEIIIMKAFSVGCPRPIAINDWSIIMIISVRKAVKATMLFTIC